MQREVERMIAETAVNAAHVEIFFLKKQRFILRQKLAKRV